MSRAHSPRPSPARRSGSTAGWSRAHSEISSLRPTCLRTFRYGQVGLATLACRHDRMRQFRGLRYPSSAPLRPDRRRHELRHSRLSRRRGKLEAHEAGDLAQAFIHLQREQRVGAGLAEVDCARGRPRRTAHSTKRKPEYTMSEEPTTSMVSACSRRRAAASSPRRFQFSSSASAGIGMTPTPSSISALASPRLARPRIARSGSSPL